jgi:hypothetical protein
MIKLVITIYAVVGFFLNVCYGQTTQSLIPLAATTDFTDKDLDLLLRQAETAKIIALSEATHGKNEPLNFRNSLIKALVLRKLIDVVALESGTIEGKVLHDYVNNSSDASDINQVLKQGFSWSFYVIPQNEELVRWLRAYNADKTNPHKVKLYGFDMPGSPGNPNVIRKMTTAVEYALGYLQQVDKSSYGYFKQRIEPFLPFLNINFDSPSSKETQFSQLQEEERLKLMGTCEELVKHFQMREVDYSRKSSKEDFEWGLLAAINGQQIFNWLSYIPIGYVPPSENKILVNSDIFHSIFNYRDRAMFDNLNWISSREPSSRIFVFASTNHLLKTPIVLTDKKSMVGQKRVLGNYLDLKYGKSYFLISNIVANNSEGLNSIENTLLSKHYDHYYAPISYFQADANAWQNYYYQTADTRVDLFRSTDLVLFDKQQTNIKFRE